MARGFLLAFLVFGLVACDGVDVTDPGSVSGTYTLRTINGEELPSVLLQNGTTYLLEITEGSLTLNEDLTCILRLTVRETDAGIVDTDIWTPEFTYTLTSGSITLTAGAILLSGSITGSSITLIWSFSANDEEVLVFRK